MRTVPKHFQLFLAVLAAACMSEPPPETVTIGKTVKISSNLNPGPGEQGTYYWQFNDKPDSSAALLLVENDKALFTPDRCGNYSLSCSLINPSNQIVNQEMFYYFAAEPENIPKIKKEFTHEPPVQKELEDTSAVNDDSDQKTETETMDEVPTSILLPQTGTGRYSIQLSSWKTRKTAVKQLEKLVAEGIDAHIDRVYLSDSDNVWYRIRIGNFSNLIDARTALKLLSSRFNNNLWIDDAQKGN